MSEERLQRALARAGYGSRRSCEELIVARKVKVNGRVATLGDKVDASRDVVELNGARVNLDPNVRYLALHKPAGVVTTMKDPQGRRDLRSLVPKEGPRVFPVGRLDRDTEGLLLLTNDGDLANKLLHPRYAIEKEYLAEVLGRPTSRHLAQLRAGVDLEDGPAKVASVRIVDARPGRGQLRLVLTEGRKREVRRLLQAVGLPVERLVRLRVGPIALAAMPPGALRTLASQEVLALQKTVAKAERRAAHADAVPAPQDDRSTGDRRAGRRGG